MTKPVATLLLNRNLKDVTDRLVEHLQKWNGDTTDVYVIESGSEPESQSKYASFVADWPEARANGLRFPRGFNFGLLELEKKQKYEHYFLICQDSLFPEAPTIAPLLEEMERYPRLGILSPCAPDWGEAKLIPNAELRCFWFVNHIAWLVRGEFLAQIKNLEDPSYLNYVYDGSNFRGYDTDIELVAKAYANGYAAGITKRTTFREDDSLTDVQFARMQTEPQRINRPEMYEEGKRWLRRKYGFNSRWNMITYVKAFYNQFFEQNPDYGHLRVLGNS